MESTNETERIKKRVNDYIEVPFLNGADKKSVRTTRKQITKEEFDEFSKERQKALKDPLGFMRKKQAELEKKLSQTENPLLRGQLKQMLERIPEQILSLEEFFRQEREIREEEKSAQDEIEAANVLLREAALAKGPLLSQKIKWMAGGFMKKTVEKLSAIPRFYHRHYEMFLVCAVLLMFLSSVIFLIMMPTLWNGLVPIIILLFVLLFTISNDATHVSEVKTGFSITLLLLFTLLETNVFCFLPVKGYALGIFDRSGNLVRVADSRSWTMKPPKFWKGERVMWQNLLNENAGQDHRLYYEGLTERTTRTSIISIDGNSKLILNGKVLVKLMAVVEKEIKPDVSYVFKHPGGADFFKSDLNQKIQKLIEEYDMSAPIASKIELKRKILAVSNDIYSIKSVKIDINAELN